MFYWTAFHHRFLTPTWYQTSMAMITATRIKDIKLRYRFHERNSSRSRLQDSGSDASICCCSWIWFFLRSTAHSCGEARPLAIIDGCTVDGGLGGADSAGCCCRLQNRMYLHKFVVALFSSMQNAPIHQHGKNRKPNRNKSDWVWNTGGEGSGDAMPGDASKTLFREWGYCETNPVTVNIDEVVERVTEEMVGNARRKSDNVLLVVLVVGGQDVGWDPSSSTSMFIACFLCWCAVSGYVRRRHDSCRINIRLLNADHRRLICCGCCCCCCSPRSICNMQSKKEVRRKEKEWKWLYIFFLLLFFPCNRFHFGSNTFFLSHRIPTINSTFLFILCAFCLFPPYINELVSQQTWRQRWKIVRFNLLIVPYWWFSLAAHRLWIRFWQWDIIYLFSLQWGIDILFDLRSQGVRMPHLDNLSLLYSIEKCHR